MTATKRYKTLRELSASQMMAIDALTAGETHAQAAEKAGVHRVTVSKWVAGHPAVQAELNRRRRELNQQRAARLRELDEAALQAISTQLDALDAEFALKWLKLRGLDIAPVTGPTDPEEIIERAVDTRREQARDAAEKNLLLYPVPGDPDRIRSEAEAELARKYDPKD